MDRTRTVRATELAGVILSIAFASWSTVATAQNQAAEWNRREVRIPMRDGVKLYAVVVSPTAQSKPLPIMLVRTPYGVAQNMRPGPIGVAYAELAQDGYTFVYQDSRGRGNSEGQFVMNGPLHDAKDPKGVDEATPNVRAEHIRGEGKRLQSADSPDLPLA
jgi:hypothetical protein